MTRPLLALLLVAGVACGPPVAQAPDTARLPPVDFSQYGTYYLWPCAANNPPQPSVCEGIVRKYISALAETPGCDPHGGSCIRRPVGASSPGATMLCNCTTAVYAGSTQAADSVLTDFYASGCSLMCCACPAQPPASYAPSSR
jgi:hypothetical protein